MIKTKILYCIAFFLICTILTGCIILKSKESSSNYFNRSVIKINGLSFRVVRETVKEETVLFENKYRNIIFIVEVRNEDNKPLGYEMGQFYAMDNNNNRYMISAIGTNSTSKGLGFENISVGGVKHEYLSISFPLNKTLAENELVLRSIVVEK